MILTPHLLIAQGTAIDLGSQRDCTIKGIADYYRHLPRGLAESPPTCPGDGLGYCLDPGQTTTTARTTRTTRP